MTKANLIDDLSQKSERTKKEPDRRGCARKVPSDQSPRWRIAFAGASLRYCPFEQIRAGHSGQNTRTRSNHCSSMARNRLGRV